MKLKRRAENPAAGIADLTAWVAILGKEDHKDSLNNRCFQVWEEVILYWHGGGPARGQTIETIKFLIKFIG